MKKPKRTLYSIYQKNKFSVMIVPESSSGNIKSRTFRFLPVVTALTIYTTVVLMIGFVLLSGTPLKNYLFSDPLGFTKDEIRDINALSVRVKGLVEEVERLKKINQNLRNAILLGDSTAINSIEYDNRTVTPKDGSVLSFNFSTLWNWLGAASSEPPLFRKPIEGFLTDDFKPESGHFGLDYSVKEGSPVFASANGYVIFSDFTVDDGYMVILAHRNNFITVYKHCSVLIKKMRDRVTQGEIIALSGNSGRLSYGPHLHFEIWKEGSTVDPRQYLLNY